MDRSEKSVYAKALIGMKTQMAMQVLRKDPKDLVEFKKVVDALFPLRKKSKDPIDKAGEEVKAELLATRNSSDVIMLLENHSMPSFNELMDSFWAELKKTRPPTKLEAVIRDINSGAYNPNFNSALRAPEEDKIEDLIGSASQQLVSQELPVPSPTKTDRTARNVKKAGSSVVASEQFLDHGKKPIHHDVADPGGSSSKTRGHAAPQSEAAEPEAPFVMSAWELRNALKFVGMQDDEVDFSIIHDQTHPEVTKFLAKRKAMNQPHKSRSQPKVAASVAGKRPREQQSGYLDEEMAPSPVRVAKPVVSPAKKQHTIVDNAQVDQLRDNSRKLQNMVNDPLADALKMSRTMQPAPADGAKKRRMFDKNGSGKQLEWDSDEDSENPAGSSLKLASPTSGGYKPRVQLQQRDGNKPASSKSTKTFAPLPSKRTRWSREEEDALIAKVREFGHGNWKLILDSLRGVIASHRNQVDLKDKWRNLIKSGTITTSDE